MNKYIKINHKYKIKVVNLILNCPDLLGYVDYNEKIIYLKNRKDKIKSLYHEIGHILFYELAIKSKDYKTRCLLEELSNNENLIEYFKKLIKEVNKWNE